MSNFARSGPMSVPASPSHPLPAPASPMPPGLRPPLPNTPMNMPPNMSTPSMMGTPNMAMPPQNLPPASPFNGYPPTSSGPSGFSPQRSPPSGAYPKTASSPSTQPLGGKASDIVTVRSETHGTFNIINFGKKYFGPAHTKYLYKIPGKALLIPIEYKSSRRWKGDDLIFMIREGEVGPEFRVILMQAGVENGVVDYGWFTSVNDSWEAAHNDLKMRGKGAASTMIAADMFGFTHDEVQKKFPLEQEEVQVASNPNITQDGDVVIIRSELHGTFSVHNFGIRYAGPLAHKYVLRGGRTGVVPVEYKASRRWKGDDLLMMTREGPEGPEFRIVYMQADVATGVFDYGWFASVNDAWDVALTDLKQRGKAPAVTLTLSASDLFGFTHDEVQRMMVLPAQEEKEPELFNVKLEVPPGHSRPGPLEYARYLGFDTAQQPEYLWIAEEFMCSRLPAGWEEYMDEANNVMYYFNADTDKTTWQHPSYIEYYRLFQKAKKEQLRKKDVEKLRLAEMENSIAGLIEYFLSSGVGEESPLITPDTVKSMCQILGIEFAHEFPLIRLAKKALRHYYNRAKEGRVAASVDEFKRAVDKERDVFHNELLLAQKDAEESRPAVAIAAERVVCVECQERPASRKCNECDDLFCLICFEKLHQKGRRKEHTVVPITLHSCVECEKAVAKFRCTQCDDVFCRNCFVVVHKRGSRQDHIPVVLEPMLIPEVQEAVSKPSRLELLMCPWVSFVNVKGQRFFFNMETDELSTDPAVMPAGFAEDNASASTEELLDRMGLYS